MAGVEKDFSKLKNTIIAEQFLRICSNRLVVFLKERSCVSLESLDKNADLYVEAQGHSSSS